jgi:integrase
MLFVLPLPAECFGQGAERRHHRRQDGMPLQLLPLPDPDGDREGEPLRRAGAAAHPGEPAAGAERQEIRRLLQAIPETKGGLRDRAIVLTLALTGRRRTEVIDMKRGDLSEENGTVFYRYRGKGGKKAKRELPLPAYEAIQQALAAWGKSLAVLDGRESLWPTDDGERSAKGLGVTSGTFYGNLQRYLRAAGLPPAGVHILRHSAAKLRRDAGESVEDVSRFLDHSSLAVTTVYLRRLEGQEDRSWRSVAEAIGVQ